MEEEGEGLRLSKRFSDKVGDGEVDFKTKSGTAWSHSYLNQKPWHPLSYPNQRRKWIAEQTQAQHLRRVEEVAREFAQEQEFFRQTALASKKEKEKMEMMKAVSFMYVRPPGYNAESAKAAEISEERKKEEQNNPQHNPSVEEASTSMPSQVLHEKKKPIPKDVFGRALPTEERFEILKNAPRMETGVVGRVKPFGVEVRNVKCLRCGNYGHQSGDRECPLKDAIMPNEESRLKRDDPLTAMLAHTDSSEPLKWELKQKPGMSPPRGGFDMDDPNQQIVAEDIFDEYGGFLGGENITELLASYSAGKQKKSKSKKKHRRQSSPTFTESKHRTEDRPSNVPETMMRSKKSKHKAKKHKHSESSSSDDDAEVEIPDRSPDDYDGRKSSQRRKHRRKKHKYSESSSSDDGELDRHRDRTRHRQSYTRASKDSDSDGRRRSKHRHSSCRGHRHRHRHRNSSDSSSE
ncbi:uncharacterized zinc finger CCHC domain-containing protein At4g19190 [Diospyros lotus]|uniref:uncharacterized zinc finger CCHC domain-containing protein At4g19190 n=1 Tax=Diospyros lotus TaxID=55363 RepID=UPI002254606E|nr:uncharacterized zinc finger CCHC domain-containing protein At4g19190 [Diospyros lotus]